MRIRELLSEQKGQSLAMVMILLIILMGFAGLAIDGGRLYMAKAQLQKAVDAGALAGADVMLQGVQASGSFNQTDSKTKATEIAVNNYNNGGTGYEASNPEGQNDVIQVFGEEEVSLTLMRLIGINKADVNAVAQVKVGKVNRTDTGAVIPIGVHLTETLQFGQTWFLTSGPGSGSNGNYGFLNFAPLDPDPNTSNGTKTVGDYIDSGSPAPIAIGQEIEVKTGDPINAPAISVPLDRRVGEIVYVPIVSEFGNGASATVTVLGFAAFELVGITGHKIEAKFVREVLPGEIGTVTTEYGTYASEIIK